MCLSPWLQWNRLRRVGHLRRRGWQIDQAFHASPALDGFLEEHASETPQNPSSQPCPAILADATKPQSRRRKRSDQGLCKTCRRGVSYPNSTGQKRTDPTRHRRLTWENIRARSAGRSDQPPAAGSARARRVSPPKFPASNYTHVRVPDPEF